MGRGRHGGVYSGERPQARCRSAAVRLRELATDPEYVQRFQRREPRALSPRLTTPTCQGLPALWRGARLLLYLSLPDARRSRYARKRGKRSGTTLYRGRALQVGDRGGRGCGSRISGDSPPRTLSRERTSCPQARPRTCSPTSHRQRLRSSGATGSNRTMASTGPPGGDARNNMAPEQLSGRRPEMRGSRLLAWAVLALRMRKARHLRGEKAAYEVASLVLVAVFIPPLGAPIR